MNEEEIKERIKKIFADNFSSSADFDFNKSAEEFPDWDSMIHMELISKMEEEFKISIDADEAVEIEKPIDFFNLILKKK